MVDRRRNDQAERLLGRLRAGDPEAFREAFDRFWRPVFSFILSFIGDRTLAEDLTQETFVRAYKGLGGMKQVSQLSTWIFGIARNVAREALRERKTRGPAIDLDVAGWQALRDQRVAQEQNVLDAELHGRVQRAVASLPEDQRLVFVLKVVSHMRYEEIASITGASVAKLKTDMHRARIAMRRKLASYFENQVPEMRG